jgi:hypothetical protein
MSSPLSDDERAQLSVRADEFHAALLRGVGSDWGPFLEGLPERMRRPVLVELVIIELIHRWEHRERPELEEYVARFPELGPIESVPHQLIVEEYRCRVKAGERYNIDRYRDRFPAQYPLIEKDLQGIRTSTVGDAASGTRVTETGGAESGAAAGLGSAAEQYEMVKPLGRGVFGEVWLARKKTSGIEKAIKIVTQSEEKESSRRERRALELIKNLRHPYLLATEDFWISEHRLHIVMELADCTLRNRLEACREAGYHGIPEGELLGYIREAAEGLDFLHVKHVIHRDVKPDNILILHGHAKVADFGLAWQQDKTLAPMQTFAGTPAYMAPEIWGKEGGPGSDLYALAVTYVEMRQGRPPFKSLPIHEMMFAHLDGILDFEPFVREEEKAVLVKAMARMPEDRHATCMEFVSELSVALGLSVVPRSGVMSVPGSRVIAAPGSGQWRGGYDSGGSIAAGTVVGHGTHGGGGSGTVTELPRVPSPAPVPPGTRRTKHRPFATLLAAALTLVLVGLLAATAWLLFGNGTTATTSGTTDTGVGGAEHTLPTPPPKTTQKDTKQLSPDPVVLPHAKAGPAPNAKVQTLADGRRVYDWVVIPVGDEQVRFRLITPVGGPGVAMAAFYIMESKVWNGLYRSGGATPSAESEKNGPDAPVTGITADEAAIFARTVFGGILPTPTEWDHAAGLFVVTDRETVQRLGGQPRVRIAKPENTHGPNAGSDVSEFGLRDMAGNGREWTRSIQTKPDEPIREVTGDPPLAAKDSVILRGRNFTLSTGLTFSTLRYEQTTPQRQFASARSPYTSFRVIIPLPPK